MHCQSLLRSQTPEVALNYDGMPVDTPGPRLRPGMVVAFAVSARGLGDLFKDQNSRAAKRIRCLTFTKYLGLVRTSSLYDPSAAYYPEDPRAPAEIVEIAFIGPSPPELSFVNDVREGFKPLDVSTLPSPHPSHFGRPAETRKAVSTEAARARVATVS